MLQQTEQQTNEYQKVKNKNSKFFQILSVILIILLLLGTIGFVVFKGDSKVENGLSAYELAVKYGYEELCRNGLILFQANLPMILR